MNFYLPNGRDYLCVKRRDDDVIAVDSKENFRRQICRQLVLLLPTPRASRDLGSEACLPRQPGVGTEGPTESGFDLSPESHNL